MFLLSVPLAPGGARAQVSPGPLAGAHQKLDGSLQCFKCHRAGSTMRERCLACHTEIAWLAERGRGLHAREAKGECAPCHPDHAGRDFAMIQWSEGAPEKFDHRRAGYALEGKHAALACRACHRPAFQVSAAAKLARRSDRARSWLGLEAACTSCHRDVHRGSLGADCLKCHDLRAWKPAPGFDHAKTSYPLTGRHTDLPCAKCHLAPQLQLAHDAQGRPVALYKPLPHAECSACHRDPHAKRLGPACARCHVVEDWKRLNVKTFDHDRTRYPLRGAHVPVPCEKCHDPVRAWGKKPRFDACAACHKDVHGGTATLAGKPADCAACHNVAAYRPSTYTVERHQTSSYPLAGKHRDVACAKCHPKKPPGVESAGLGSAGVPLRPLHDRCAACHADVHGTAFAKRADRGACETCHAVAGWAPSRVDVAAHRAYRFALDGAHGAAPCFACHTELKPGAPAKRPLDFAVRDQRCVDCHENPHGAQFAPRRDGGACEACHDVTVFAPAARFNHARDAGFKLEGTHARVACAKCHAKRKDTDGKVRTIWRPVPGKCESCHDKNPGPLGAFPPDASDRASLLAAHSTP
ncbi:MAG: hypothetical protein HZC42_10860 [Candidatus Eisenbacteria bacterium]|nr:hypothetical protein [Candidatus Eisenbacteria bacterium]